MKKCAYFWQFSAPGWLGLLGRPERTHVKKRLKLASTICLRTALFVFAFSARANPPLKAEVMHWWTSPGESAAVEQFAQAFNKAGGEWVDVAIVGGNNAIPAEISRVTGGNPPTAMQLPLGKQLDDLVAQHLLLNLDDLATQENFKAILPDVFLKAATYDGHVYALPVNNHGHNWLWYNKLVLEKAGVKEPVTWEDFWDAVNQIKHMGGIIPVAVGAQPWQLGQTFFSVLLSKEGPDLYFKAFRDLDVNAVKSAQFKDAAATFIKLRDYSDDGAANRDWNVAANMVITGKAGFQFMGDWAKGEYLAAGQTPGKEFNGVLLGENGRTDFTVSADAFVFPVNNRDPEQIKAQKLLAKIMIDPATQVAFNSKKGSEPVRLDLDASKLDACAQYGMKALQKPDQRIRCTDFLDTPDFIGAERDLTAQFWADKSMSVEQFVDAFVKIVETDKTHR
jgi:glucose/mannose transport system substrate-binding protein